MLLDQNIAKVKILDQNTAKAKFSLTGILIERKVNYESLPYVHRYSRKDLCALPHLYAILPGTHISHLVGLCNLFFFSIPSNRKNFPFNNNVLDEYESKKSLSFKN